MHGAALIRALRQQHPDMRISAVAGEAMRRAGCHTVVPMESLNVMGLGDVLRALPRVLGVARTITEWAQQQRPDLVVLIDFPGFHLRLGKRLRRLGIPVLYYIAPKLWAWGSWRVKRLAQAQDRLACILPFEAKWFAARGIQARYVGNPSAFACHDRGWSRQALCQHLKLDAQRPVIALLPGSRNSELTRHAQLLADVARALQQSIPGLQCIACRAPGISDMQLSPLLDAGCVVLDRLHQDYALRVDAALAVSGTATLELALWNTPTVLVYRNSATMMFLARRLVALRCAGLANIIMDDTPVMPECIQEQATVERIMPLMHSLLTNPDAAKRQRLQFATLRQRLGNQNPAIGLCQMIDEILGSSPIAS